MEFDLGRVNGPGIERHRHDDGVGTALHGPQPVLDHPARGHVYCPGQDGDLAPVGLDGDLDHQVALGIGEESHLARRTQHEKTVHTGLQQEADVAFQGGDVDLTIGAEGGAHGGDDTGQRRGARSCLRRSC